MEAILIEPTDKYWKYIKESAHYLNCPKHMLNESIRSVTFGYDKENAFFNLKSFFNLTGHRFANSRIMKIIDFHQSITWDEFRILNPNNGYPFAQYVEQRNQEIDNYIERKTIWAFGRRVNQPSFPFRNNL